MKTLFRVITIALVVYVLIATTSCTSYTCPTYASNAKVAMPKDI